MKSVLVGRHGEAEANVKRLLAGAKTNSDLTELGEQQAHELANNLAGRDIALIVSSPLSRALKTAEIVAADVGYHDEIAQSPLFIERDFGSATDLPEEEGFAMLDNGTAVGSESIPDFAERAERALEWLKKRPESEILVISHGGFGQMLGTIASGGRAEDFLSFHKLSNGNVFELTLE